MPITHAPSLDRLHRAVELTEEIAKLEAEFQTLMGGWSSGGLAPVVTRAPKAAKVKGKRFVSAEARAKMAAAQKARWAKKAANVAPAAKKKGGMSPEGRARVAAAMKARWAAAKKKGGKAPNARKS